MMKSAYLTALTVFTFLLFERCGASANYQPDQAAKHTITLEIVEEQPAAAALDSLVVRVKERLEKAGCVYNGVQFDADKRKLKIGVVELPDRKGIHNESRLEFLETYLSTGGKLEFCEFWNKDSRWLERVNILLEQYLQVANISLEPYGGQQMLLADSTQKKFVDVIIRKDSIQTNLPNGAIWATLEENYDGLKYSYLLIRNKVQWFENQSIEKVDVLNTGDNKLGVVINFKPEYHDHWATLTRNMADRQAQLGILMDGELIMAPRVVTEIPFGRVTISGQFSEAKIWALSDILSLKPYPLSVRLLK